MSAQVLQARIEEARARLRTVADTLQSFESESSLSKVLVPNPTNVVKDQSSGKDGGDLQ